MIDPEEKPKIFYEAHKEYLVPVIEEANIPTSELEDKMPVHLIPDEGESVRLNENSEKSSDFTHHKKDADTETSSYDMVLNVLKKLDTLYNPTMTRMQNPFIAGICKVRGDTRVIPIVDNEDDEI